MMKLEPDLVTFYAILRKWTVPILQLREQQVAQPVTT